MVLHILIRYLANNEHLVQKLSESYPLRKAAQFVVKVIYHSKYMLEEKGLNRRLTPEEFKEAMRRVAQNLQGQIKQASDELKRKK